MFRSLLLRIIQILRSVSRVPAEAIKEEGAGIKVPSEPIIEPPRKNVPTEPLKEIPEATVNKVDIDSRKASYPAGVKNYEEQFETTHRDSDGVIYSFDVSDKFEFPLTFLRPKGVSNFYYKSSQKKTAVVLHFTVGYITGDIGTLIEQDSHMSVPFVIGRNGIVYQLFSSRYWSYHLGRGAIGGNTAGSKRSVAIELSNIGPLRLDGNNLNTIYGSKYCTLAETPFYTKLDTSYREYTYYATFTDAQYESLKELLDYLCGNYNSPRQLMDENKRYELFSSDEEARSYKGICSHVNFRAYGKVDIGPAFDWNRIV